MAIEMAQHPTTIAEAAGVCFNSFQQCMQQSVSVSPRDASIVEGQLARFSLWASNIAVFASGRASLDHRLREAPEVQEVISGILEVLDDRINECSSCFKAAQTSSPDAPQDPEKEALEKTRQDIATQIALLHRLSNTIRHASSEAQNAKAASTFKILDESGNDVEPWLRIIFVNYVRDKFRTIDEPLLQRLVSAMILRRRRVLYRRHRFGNSALRAPQTKPQPAVKAPEYSIKQVDIKETTEQNPESGPSRKVKEIPQSKSQAGFSATTLAPERFKKASAASTVSGAKTVALNKHEELPFPAAPLGGVKKRYNEMKRAREKEYALYVDSLDPTDTAGIEKAQANLKNDLHGYWQESLRVIGEVVCPFCFYAVPALEVNEDSKWKSHVRNDLDPYVCLFEDCDTPDQLYRHSEEWLKHMREHALRWRCNSKSHGPLVFSTSDQYTEHMKESHRGAFNDAQIRVLANRSARAGPLFESCPFCGMDDFDKGRKIEDHLVGHLRFLALKSLPLYQDEVSDGLESQSASSRISKPHKRSTIDNDPDRHTTFTLEDHEEIFDLDRDDDTPALGRAEWNFVLKDIEASAHVEADPIILHLASEQLPTLSATGSLIYRDIHTRSATRDQLSCDDGSKNEKETAPIEDAVCETIHTSYPCVISDDSDSVDSSHDTMVRKLITRKLSGSREYIRAHDDKQRASNTEIRTVPVDESSVLETDRTGSPNVSSNDSDSIHSSHWVEAKKPSYDVTDWGEDEWDEYDDDPTPPVPQPPPNANQSTGDIPSPDTAARILASMELPIIREHVTTHKGKQRVQSPPPSPSLAGYDPEQSRHDPGSIQQRAEIENTTDDISFPALWPPTMPLQRDYESILMNSNPGVVLNVIRESPSTTVTGGTEDLNLDYMIARILGTIGRVTRRICLKNQEITAICTRSRELFLSQPMLLELGAPVKIVGDVHGQFTDLIRIFLMSGFPPTTNYLFLGDYVDRGKQSLETILLLLCFKLKYPQNFFLLRGNHECANVTRVYGFYDECKRRCNIKIWKTLIDVFNCLPVAAIVAKKIFCVHGGLSPSLSHMDDIRLLARPTDVPDYGLLNDLLWSDPADMEEEWEPNERGVSYCFNKSVIQRFLTRHDFDLICRAHMVVEDGYEFYEDRLLVTVFSASNYCGEFDNWGAVMNVSSELLCSFELIKPEEEKISAAKFRESIRSTFSRSLQSVLSIF